MIFHLPIQLSTNITNFNPLFRDEYSFWNFANCFKNNKTPIKDIFKVLKLKWTKNLLDCRDFRSVYSFPFYEFTYQMDVCRYKFSSRKTKSTLFFNALQHLFLNFHAWILLMFSLFSSPLIVFHLNFIRFLFLSWIIFSVCFPRI